MKKILSIPGLLVLIHLHSFGQNVGINTDTPQATLDVNGDVIFRSGELSLNDIDHLIDANTFKFSYYRITGPTADLDIFGITAGMDGRMVTLFNRSSFNLIFHPQHPDVNPEERMLTSNGEDLTIPDRGMVCLMYDGTEAMWIVKNTSATGGGTTGWEGSGENVFYENNVGIGTSEPVSPLTIQTENNSIGLTQIGGIDSITLATRINDVSATIGTTSNHVLSLAAGGIDQVHVWPDGRVVLGEDADPNSLLGGPASRATQTIAKLTLETPINSIGWMHVGGPDSIIIREGIGGVSASIGTETNHALRLMTNNLGRFHIINDGKITISPNDYATQGQLTVYQLNQGQNGLAVVTPNNTHGIVQIGGDGQVLAMHMGGSSAGIGTYTNHKFRLFCNGVALMNLEPNGNVGVGAEFPTEKLTIYTPGGGYGMSQRADDGTFLTTHVAGGSASIGTWSNTNFRLRCNSMDVINMTPTGKVGIGTTNPVQKLDVNGTIRAKEVIVELANWPDYVFAKDYPLSSLHELENFIAEHHHLPNVPSAGQVEENGQHLGNLQQKMMEKIEELTLHIIALNKRIELLETANNK